MSRPVKVPEPEELRSINGFMVLIPEVTRILKKCGAPEYWGVMESKLLLACLLRPEEIDAVDFRKTGTDCYVTVKEDKPGRVIFATLFAKMFSEGKFALIRALPRIRKAFQRRAQRAELLAELAVALMHELDEAAAIEFFRSKNGKKDAVKVASSFGKKTITAKTVENVRSSIRSKLSSAEMKQVRESRKTKT